MTLKEIEAFYWTAALGSFSVAATRLHITQSSLSKRVAELEESVGAVLLDGSSKKVQLTEAGQRLLPVARQMLDLMESMRTEAAASARLSGDCRFGISELVALTWLPQLVSTVRHEHPGLRLQPYVDLARSLEKRVVRGELDFAVAPGPAESESVESETIASVEFTWTAAPGRLGAGAVLTAAELLQYPLITMTEGSGLTRAFEAWAGEQGLRARQTVACNSLMGIVGLTIADVGISFLPARYIQPWLERGTLVAAFVAATPAPAKCPNCTRAPRRRCAAWRSSAWSMPTCARARPPSRTFAAPSSRPSSWCATATFRSRSSPPPAG